MAKSRPDFVQKPYYKKSHKAMYVDIDGKPRRLCKGDTLTEEGKAAYKAALLEKGKEPEPEPVVETGDNPTVAALVDDFLAALKVEVKKKKRAQRTYDWYDDHLQRFAKFIKNKYGIELTVSEFKKSQVKKWLDSDYPDAGDNYLNGAVRAVSRVFNWAVEEEVIAVNPIAGYKRAGYEPRECYLTDDQWQTLLAKLRTDDPFTDFVWFLYLTGCRPHEARIAEAKHFDRKSKCLIFERLNSKGKKVRRVILLEGKALEIVSRRACEGLIFTNQRGNPWTSYALNCRFRWLRKKLDFECFPYIFRHTFITNALIRGLHPMTVAALVGHKDATMVMKVYGHLAKDNDHLRAELLRAIA